MSSRKARDIQRNPVSKNKKKKKKKKKKNTNELGLQRKFKARLYKIKSKKTAGDLGVV